MKYRLKDKELQEKLDDITGGTFSVALHTTAKRFVEKYGKKDYWSSHVMITTTTRVGLDISINSEIIESAPEYDPHAWNKYPEVEPPKDVWMRCENVYGSEPERLERFAARYTSQYEDGEWVDAWFSNGLRRDVTSFRPWDEEDEE